MGTDMKSALAVVLLLACVLGASATWTETLGDLAETTMLTSTGYTTSNCNCTNCDRGHHKLVDPEVASTTTECEAACDADSECRGSLHDSVWPRTLQREVLPLHPRHHRQRWIIFRALQ